MGALALPAAKGVTIERRAGRDEQVAALFDEHYAGLCRLATLLLDDRGAAEEVVQEAFLRTYSGWWRIRHPERARAYLRAAVVNQCRSRGRRRVSEDRGNRQRPGRRDAEHRGGDRRPRPCSRPFERCRPAERDGRPALLRGPPRGGHRPGPRLHGRDRQVPAVQGPGNAGQATGGANVTDLDQRIRDALAAGPHEPPPDGRRDGVVAGVRARRARRARTAGGALALVAAAAVIVPLALRSPAPAPLGAPRGPADADPTPLPVRPGRRGGDGRAGRPDRVGGTERRLRHRDGRDRGRRRASGWSAGRAPPPRSR